MAESRTYRRVPQDQKEVEYIVGLIDADVKARAGDLATTGDTEQLRDLLNTQKRWREIRAELSDTVVLANAIARDMIPANESTDKEVKPEPREKSRTKTNAPNA